MGVGGAGHVGDECRLKKKVGKGWFATGVDRHSVFRYDPCIFTPLEVFFQGLFDCSAEFTVFIMPYTASDLRKGLKLRFEGQPYTITEYNFTKPGKGQSIYTCRLKHMLTGNTFVKNFRENDVFDELDLSEKTVNFSYDDGVNFIFSDADYNEISVPADVMGDKKYFLEDNIECRILFLDGNPVEVNLPTFIERKIEWCDAGAKGNTAAGKVMKNARVAGGYELKVPIFVNENDWIRIDTRSGEYADRVMGRR